MDGWIGGKIVFFLLDWRGTYPSCFVFRRYRQKGAVCGYGSPGMGVCLEGESSDKRWKTA